MVETLSGKQPPNRRHGQHGSGRVPFLPAVRGSWDRSVKLWLANKADRPNRMYRIMILKFPKTVQGTITGAGTINPFDVANFGNTGNKIILPLDKDKGIVAYYDRVINCQNANPGTAAGTNREGHWSSGLRKRNLVLLFTTIDRERLYVNNTLLFYVIPYDSFGTLITDNIASASYYCGLYCKDN
jgi:hypothetical protein